MIRGHICLGCRRNGPTSRANGLSLQLFNLPTERLGSPGWLNQTLPKLLAEQTRRSGKRVAIQEDKRSVTFAELGQIVERLAAGLVERGIKPGDIVAYHLAPSIEAV